MPGVCVCVWRVQLCSPGAASQSNLKMKHLGLLISAKIFHILFLRQVGSCFIHSENTQPSYYPLIRKKTILQNKSGQNRFLKMLFTQSDLTHTKADKLLISIFQSFNHFLK